MTVSYNSWQTEAHCSSLQAHLNRFRPTSGTRAEHSGKESKVAITVLCALSHTHVHTCAVLPAALGALPPGSFHTCSSCLNVESHTCSNHMHITAVSIHKKGCGKSGCATRSRTEAYSGKKTGLGQKAQQHAIYAQYAQQAHLLAEHTLVGHTEDTERAQ